MIDKLTSKQQRFTEEYLIDLNATQAAIRAGYSEKGADVQGSNLLVNVKVSAAIQAAMAKRSERTQITADKILEFWGNIVLTPITEYFDQGPDGGLVPKDIKDLLPAAIMALQSVKVDFSSVSNESDDLSKGTTSFIKLDVMRASENAAKHLGMFIERKEIGKPGDFAELSDDELDSFIEKEEREYLQIKARTPETSRTESTKILPSVH